MLPEHSCRVVDSGPGFTEVELHLEGPATLVHAASFTDGWQAETDSGPLPIARAYEHVQSVEVESSTRRVRFEFTTPGLLGGAAISLTTLLLLFGLLSWHRRAGSVL